MVVYAAVTIAALVFVIQGSMIRDVFLLIAAMMLEPFSSTFGCSAVAVALMRGPPVRLFGVARIDKLTP